MKKQLTPAALALALLLAPGCSTRIEIVHGEPRVIDSIERLSAETEKLDGGVVRLRVFREQDHTTETDYWRKKVVGQSRGNLPGPWAAIDRAPQVASASDEFKNLDSNAVIVLGIIAIIVAIVAVAAVALVPVTLVYGAAALVQYSKPLDEQRFTLRHMETERSPSVAASLEANGGGERVDLGPQPLDGYVLDLTKLRRFGFPGKKAVVRDGDLSTTVEIPE